MCSDCTYSCLVCGLELCLFCFHRHSPSCGARTESRDSNRQSTSSRIHREWVRLVEGALNRYGSEGPDYRPLHQSNAGAFVNVIPTPELTIFPPNRWASTNYQALVIWLALQDVQALIERALDKRHAWDPDEDFNDDENAIPPTVPWTQTDDEID
jgi:hypothetical protein